MSTRSFLLGAVVVIMATTALWSLSVQRSATRWERTAVEALDSATVANRRADSLQAAAQAAQKEVERLSEDLIERGDRIQERVVEVREVEVPGDCAPFVEPRDEIIDTLTTQLDYWQDAFQRQVEAFVALDQAFTEQSTVVGNLATVLRDRPGDGVFRWPKVGVGGFTGFCSSGPCIGVGLTFSWEIDPWQIFSIMTR